MKIRLAFTGTGYISQVHAEAARKLPEVELAAVVNYRPESRKVFAERFGIERQYDQITDLLGDGEVDAVVVSTPNYLHAPESLAALNAGVHVMVEKPMAMNADEARQMLASSEASQARLMVAHNWRFDPEVRWLRQQVVESRLGKIVRTKGYGVHVNWGPSGWFTQKEQAGGGAMADMGIHAIDTVRYLLGDPQPVRVYAHIGTYYKSFDVDDTGILIVHWDNEVVSYIESGWWQPHSDGLQSATQLYGTAGFGELFPTHLLLPNVEKGEKNRIDPGFPVVRSRHSPQSMYDEQMAYFTACIQNGETPNPGGLEGWNNMRVVDAAYESARTGQAVNLTH